METANDQPPSSSGKQFEKLVEVAPNQSMFLFANGYSLLSNVHYTPFSNDKIRYRSVEQFVYAKKALQFKDYVAHQGIMDERCARKYKEFRIQNYVYPQWTDKMKDVVLAGLKLKFEQCRPSREKLLSTGDAMILYATPFDRVLGTGLELDDDRNLNPAQWEGQNDLGVLLMQVRDLLQQSVA